MNTHRKTALKKNTLMSLAFELTTIICGFILPKFILEYYGSATNGLVSSITHFLGFISLCELGMGAVVPASLYRPLAQKDMKSVSAVVVSAQKFYRIIAALLAGYVICLVAFYPRAVNDFDYFFTASLIVVLSVTTFAQYYFGITYSLLLKADQKQYISFEINTATLIANTILSIVLIQMGLSIHVVKCVSACIFILRPLALTAYVKKHYALNLKTKYEGEPIRQKWNGMAQHFAATIQEKADTVILTLLCSLESVSVYGVYFMVINGIKGLIYALTAGMSAMIGNILAKDETEELRRTFSKFEWMMHTVATLLFTITAILVVPFVEVYTYKLPDKAIYIEPIFASILCVALAARCIQMPYNVVVHAAGHFRQTQRSAIIEPIINVVVSVVMVNRYGLIGVAIGTLLSMMYRVFYLAIYLMRNIVHIRPGAFAKQIVVDIASVVLIIAATSWIDLSADTYLQWFVLAIGVTLIASAVCLVINALIFRENTTKLVRTMLKKAK